MKLNDNQMDILALIIFKEINTPFICEEMELCLKEQGYEYNWEDENEKTK